MYICKESESNIWLVGLLLELTIAFLLGGGAGMLNEPREGLKFKGRVKPLSVAIFLKFPWATTRFLVHVFKLTGFLGTTQVMLDLGRGLFLHGTDDNVFIAIKQIESVIVMLMERVTLRDAAYGDRSNTDDTNSFISASKPVNNNTDCQVPLKDTSRENDRKLNKKKRKWNVYWCVVLAWEDNYLPSQAQ